jgi:hypothetical protein
MTAQLCDFHEFSIAPSVLSNTALVVSFLFLLVLKDKYVPFLPCARQRSDFASPTVGQPCEAGTLYPSASAALESGGNKKAA